MNTPNKLTILRIILLIPIMLLLVPVYGSQADFVKSDTARYLAIVLFIIASITDFIDGRLARRFNLVSNFGKLMDPIADKLLVIGVFMALVELGRISSLLVLIVLARELLVTGIRQIAAAEGTVIQAGTFGKWKAALQMFSLIYLLFEPIIIKAWGLNLSSVELWGNILIALTVVITVASGWDYYHKYKDVLQENC